MKRQIVKIDENKCNGCGLCVPACHEGAIKIINGKARLVEDSLCDGLGACLGECPQGAILIEEREAEKYAEDKAHPQVECFDEVKRDLTEKGIPVNKRDKTTEVMPCGCPGSMTRDFRKESGPVAKEESRSPLHSELQQWPIQLRLLNPHAPFFQDAELLIAADCVPFTYADFHQRFLKGKILIMFCPKLDPEQDEYIEKLAAIFRDNNIKTVSIVRMEVPCCAGVERIVEEALQRSGKRLVLHGYTISLRGEII